MLVAAQKSRCVVVRWQRSLYTYSGFGPRTRSADSTPSKKKDSEPLNAALRYPGKSWNRPDARGRVELVGS